MPAPTMPKGGMSAKLSRTFSTAGDGERCEVESLAHDRETRREQRRDPVGGRAERERPDRQVRVVEARGKTR